jgi:hypothetical protein
MQREDKNWSIANFCGDWCRRICISIILIFNMSWHHIFVWILFPLFSRLTVIFFLWVNKKKRLAILFLITLTKWLCACTNWILYWCKQSQCKIMFGFMLENLCLVEFFNIKLNLC